MSQATLILVILVATLLASHVSCQPISPTYRVAFCRNAEYGNYTTNSTYEDNLKTVLSELEDHASIEAFYNTSAGSGASTVYGQYYCRGDVSSDFCSQCIQEATKKALNCSNAKTVVVWYQECTLRYMNQSMYGVNDVRRILKSYSLSNLTIPDDDFSAVLNETVSGLIQEAAHGTGLTSYLATAEKKVSAFTTAYFLVQCSPDLNERQCESCLLSAFNATRTCCGEWPIFLYSFPPSCQVMYDTESIFYFTSNIRSPPPASSATPPPPLSMTSEPSTSDQVQTLPSSSTTTRNTGGSAVIRSNESIKLGIITIVIVLLMLVLQT